jgi:RNA polymerase sigma-70 factor, ECF subfamily
VQETFARALERPPADTSLPWRPWLTRVAVNLGRDLLRRRRRTAYVGPWLPEPIETAEPLDLQEPPDARYDLLESMSYAFLVALEALSPPQRAVLLLRDVFDYSVAETAASLAFSEANVKTTHHRARKAMAAYDRDRPPGGKGAGETRRALEAFALAVAQGDVAAVEALLAEPVRALSDGGGEYLAARVPLFGRQRVASTYVKLGRLGGSPSRWAIRSINGLPTLILEHDRPPAGQAPRVLLGISLDASGRIAGVYSVLASAKLAAINPI